MHIPNKSLSHLCVMPLIPSPHHYLISRQQLLMSGLILPHYPAPILPTSTWHLCDVSCGWNKEDKTGKQD